MGDRVRQLESRLTGFDACSVLPDIEIDQNAEMQSRCGRGLLKVANILRMIDNDHRVGCFRDE